MKSRPNSISHMIRILKQFWRDHGSCDLLPLNHFAGAATFHPQCILGSLNDKSTNFVYVGHGVRHDDRTGGISPHRYLQHIQLQLLWKLPPKNILDLYNKSLEAIGLDVENRNMRYLDSSWETKSFGGFGRGLEISCDLLEITQFTYFTQMCDIKLSKIPIEITYGIERLALIIWPEYEHINHVPWSENMTYGEMRLYEEKDRSSYLEMVKFPKDEMNKKLDEVTNILDGKNIFGAFYKLLSLADYFNELNAQRALNHYEKIQYIQSIRKSVNIMGRLYKKCYN